MRLVGEKPIFIYFIKSQRVIKRLVILAINSGVLVGSYFNILGLGATNLIADGRMWPNTALQTPCKLPCLTIDLGYCKTTLV